MTFVVKHLDIAKTFDCGQSFRFDKTGENSWSGVAFGRFVTFTQPSPDTLEVTPCTSDEWEQIWQPYFALDMDYDTMRADIVARCDRDTMRHALDAGSGIRILRQDSWEALASFIISQNNNIPRIKGSIMRLCAALGEPIGGDNFAFFTPESLLQAGEEPLRSCGVGFRAKYLLDAAEKVTSGALDLAALKQNTTEQALAALQSVRGVGPKVAACVALFGLGKMDAFPRDVWVNRSMTAHFDADFDPFTLGEYAGLAQQYLFYRERYL